MHRALKMGVGGRMASSPRQLLLIILSQVLAWKPFASRKLENVMNRLRQEEGEATAVEAAGQVAMIEAYSKMSDATGRAAIPKIVQIILPRLIRIRKCFVRDP
mmetsp:Transcript_15588/g.29772  ORF Transcript_15588/g.29772 Transcript_15588/m.29772 type:complete len:103 (+) Transcript_15588:1213-1521(+)